MSVSLDDYGSLHSHHARLLHNRAVGGLTATTRGYYSTQRWNGSGPGLVILWHPLDRDAPPIEQFRADDPGDGPKYRFEKDTVTCLDVHPGARREVMAGTGALWMVEGITKADALITAGRPALGMNGIRGWQRDKEPLPDLDVIPLRKRDVYVCPDADVATNRQVWEATSRLATELRKRKAKVHIVRVPPVNGDPHTGVDDFIAYNVGEGWTAAEVVAELEDAATTKLPPRPSDNPPVVTGRPQVDMSSARPVYDIAAEVVGILVDRGDVYRHGHDLVQAARDGEGRMALAPVDEGAFTNLLCARVDPTSGTGPSARYIAVPRAVRASAMAWRGDPLADVAGITATPILHRDGSVVTTPGYDPVTRLLYVPTPRFVMAELPEAPTAAEIAAAVALLDDALCGFSFPTPVDRANTLALLVTLVVRPTVDLAPLFGLDSPAPGSGKGLIVNLASIIAAGDKARTYPWPDSNEEARKAIMSILREGDAGAVLLDEVRTIEGRAFANVLTSTMWSDRLLGVSQTGHFANRVTWTASGNNIAVRDDLTRRVVMIRLDPNVENPAMRSASSFRHPALLAWALTHRAELLRAVLVLVRAWHAAGRPKPAVAMGSFEEWAEVVGGVLAVAGVEGFLGNQLDVIDQGDDDQRAWETVLRHAHIHYGDRPWTARQLGTLIRPLAEEGVLPLTFGDPDQPGFTVRVGHGLHQRRDRWVQGLRLGSVGRVQGGLVHWKVEARTADPEQWPW